ncbi:MAG: tetratricopeptide repeat protein, partial [Bacteroidota bacterium]
MRVTIRFLSAWGCLSLLLSCVDSPPQAPNQPGNRDSLEGYADAAVSRYSHSGDTLRARTLLDSAQVLASEANYPDALALVQEALTVYLDAVGENDPLTAQAYLLAGKIYILLDQQPALALQAVERGMEILRITLGEDHMKYADALNLRGIMARRSGQDSLALYYFRQSLSILETKSNVATFRLANMYNNLSIVFWDQQRVDSAFLYIRKGIRLHQSSPEKDSHNALNLANSYNTLSITFA